MAAACRLSFRPEESSAEFEAALDGYDLAEPLWPALARHLARRAQEGDRELLEERARNPSGESEALRWGLRYIVRGDVLLEDGTVVQLDDLSQEVGLEPLAYLEDLPQELDLGE
jgi:hypothetical protein